MKQRTKRVVTAWIMTLLMVLSVVVIPGGVAKANEEPIHVEFRGATLDEGDTTAKTLVFTIGGKAVKVQCGKKTEGDVFVAEAFGEANGNGNYELSCTPVAEYYLKISNENAVDYRLRVDGFDENNSIVEGFFQLKKPQSGVVLNVELEQNGGNTQPNNDVKVSLVDYTDEEHPVEAVVFENNQIQGTTQGITFEDGAIRLTGCNYTGKTLKIAGNPRIDVYGINKFQAIELTQGSGFEMWGRMSGDFRYDDMDGVNASTNNIEANYGHIQLNNGITGPKNGMANGVSFRNALIVDIGSETQPAPTAFSNIDRVIFWNYDFHDRKANNGYIYANTSFKGVPYVEVQSSKIKVKASTKLFDKDELENKIECVTFQEGVLELTGTKGDVTLKNKYYKSYPADNGKSGFLARQDNAGDAGEPYVTSKEITETATVDNSAIDKGAYKLTVNGTTTTIESKDVILYSVSYKIDEGIGFDHPDAGSVTMDGFSRGYYIIDERDGHFEAWIAAGETVNVTILPNAGYQYIKNTLNINGAPIETAARDNNEDVGKYWFVMPANAGHVCAGFAKTEDVVMVDSTKTNIQDAALDIDDAEIKQGNAKLEIDSADEITDADKEKIASVVPDADENTVYEYMDVTLSESVVKNYDSGKADSEQDSWDKALTDLNKEAKITLTLADNLKNFDYYEVVRIHNNIAEKLEGVSILSGGKIKFATDKFSTYAIVGKSAPVYVQNGVDCSEPKSGKYTIDGDTVTIDNLVLDVDKEYAELCLYGKEYGKTPMTLIVKGTNKVKNLIFDTKVNVICEEGASLSFDAKNSELTAKNEYTGTQGGYTLGTNTVLEGGVFKYKAPEPQTPPSTENPPTPAPVTPTPSEVGTTVTDKTNTNSSYVVSEKATGTNGVGEATYTGENAGSTANKVTIPDTFTGSDGVTYAVTKVEDGALKNNTAVTEVTVGDNVEEIGTGAFQNASNLTTVKLGKKVKKVGKNAFNGCKKLKTFKTNGTELTTVEEAAFKNNTSLTSVDLSKCKIKKIGKNSFNGCKKLGKFKVNGNYITKAEKGAFSGTKKNAVFTICAKNKTKYNKVKKLFKKAGASKAKFKFKKQK